VGRIRRIRTWIAESKVGDGQEGRRRRIPGGWQGRRRKRRRRRKGRKRRRRKGEAFPVWRRKRCPGRICDARAGVGGDQEEEKDQG
jgi:hypothetical protein